MLCLHAAGEKHGLDLTKKKPIIKATAIRYCQEHAEVQEGDDAEEEEAEGKAEVAVDGNVIAAVEEVHLHDDCHSNLRSITLGLRTLLHIDTIAKCDLAAMQATAADEEKPVAAVAEEQPAVNANGDKSHTEAPAAEGGAKEDGAVIEAEQDEAARKAALAAGNGTQIVCQAVSIVWQYETLTVLIVELLRASQERSPSCEMVRQSGRCRT